LDVLLGSVRNDVNVEVLVPRTITERFEYSFLTVRHVGRLSGHAWEQLELPFYAWSGILFTPTGSAPLIHPRNILTIHDAIVFAAPAGFSRAYLAWYRMLSLVLCRTAAHILTVSEFSKQELVRWCKASPRNISVVYPGALHMLSIEPDNSILERFSLKPFSYALAVGSSSPNKNFISLIAALDYLEGSGINVVLVGQTGSMVGRHGSKQKPLLTARVNNIGYVTDGELRALYESAGCFAFPSLYEGFGLPPLEAMSLGCPTVVSNAASLPEVCGSVALLCNPYEPKDIAEKIKAAVRLRENPANADVFTEFASQYTYKQCAQKVWDILSAAARGENLELADDH
jgi:glycosyltransferase involved in cell wall biosynthesis